MINATIYFSSLPLSSVLSIYLSIYISLSLSFFSSLRLSSTLSDTLLESEVRNDRCAALPYVPSAMKR